MFSSRHQSGWIVGYVFLSTLAINLAAETNGNTNNNDTNKMIVLINNIAQLEAQCRNLRSYSNRTHYISFCQVFVQKESMTDALEICSGLIKKAQVLSNQDFSTHVNDPLKKEDAFLHDILISPPEGMALLVTLDDPHLLLQCAQNLAIKNIVYDFKCLVFVRSDILGNAIRTFCNNVAEVVTSEEKDELVPVAITLSLSDAANALDVLIKFGVKCDVSGSAGYGIVVRKSDLPKAKILLNGMKGIKLISSK